MIKFASEFSEIPEALRNNPPLKERVLLLINQKPIVGKVTEGGNRLEAFRKVLASFVNGEIDFNKALTEVETAIPRYTSIHSGDNRVFASGWPERLLRTQLSRFYNQAVMEEELGKGNTECFVPPSSAEKTSSACSQFLAGKVHDISHLHQLLISSYENGDFSNKGPKIPDHPHCTHVVKPLA
ncbi:TPA: hypothetical protein ACPTCW_000123 [Yersinia enterocolitica]|uniref:hypothetical protein n=1 Tax=Yersinia sp. LJYL362 TaxID=3402108 RepID=UPI003AB64664